MNIVEDFKFYGNQAHNLLYFAKALNLISLKVFCITGANIIDEAADELFLALRQYKTLTKFEISDSQIMNASANKLIHSLDNGTT